MVKDFLKWYYAQANTGSGKRQFVFAVIIPLSVLVVLFLLVCGIFALTYSGSEDTAVPVKITPKPTIVKTIAPTATSTQVTIYDDSRLAKTILSDGANYVSASSEFPSTLLKGDLDMAERGREAIILKISDNKSDLKKMNIKDNQMRSSWESYLEKESMFLYHIGKVIKSQRKDEYSNARASMITAQKYLEEANTHYQKAKTRALKMS